MIDGHIFQILHLSESHVKDDERNTLIRVELLDIDVRAVRAVLTYIYTAYFIPVVDVNVLNDVKQLVDRYVHSIDKTPWVLTEVEVIHPYTRH